MNIESLNEYCNKFNELIVESGFKRDMNDFINSMAANQGNIIGLKDMAKTIENHLHDIFDSDLPEVLNKIFVTPNIVPFTSEPHNEVILELIQDTTIEVAEFYQKLTQFLANLNKRLDSNINEVKRIQDFINPFVEQNKIYQKEEGKSIVSIILKNKGTLKNVVEVAKEMTDWNKTILVYHQILNSSSPEAPELIEVQNGSIDFLLNIDATVASNLINLFGIALDGFIAYLIYKQRNKEIEMSYRGNPKLTELEKQKDDLLLENIGLAVTNAIAEQHKSASLKDSKILKNGDKYIQIVSDKITSHVVKGNDLKLISYSEDFDSEKEEEVKEHEERIKQFKEIERKSIQTRNELKKLPEASELLLEHYGHFEIVEE